MKFLKLIAVFTAALFTTCSAKLDLGEKLRVYTSRCPAEVGVAVILQDRDTIVVNDGHYPMNSVLKMYQALPTAGELSRRGIRPDSTILVERNRYDADTWSPMFKTYTDSKFSVSYISLLQYALEQSDNNACDILFDHTVGIPGVNAYWHNMGITDFNISWNEAQMHESPARSDDNWTTPLAAARAINHLVPHCLASSDLTTSQVAGILMHCATGTARIPAPLQGTGAIVAHNTGTGFDDAEGHPTGINDVAFVMLPDGRSYSLAVFVKTSRTDMPGTEKIIADISEIVYNHITQP